MKGRSARESKTMTQQKPSTVWLLRVVCQCEVRYSPVQEASELPSELRQVSSLTCPVCRQRYVAFPITERRTRQEGPPRGGERRRDAPREFHEAAGVNRRRAASMI